MRKLPCAVTIAALSLAGCGGSSSRPTTADFATDYRATVASMTQTSHALGVAILRASSQTDDEVRVTYGDLATRWDSALSRLRSLTPPATVKTGYGTLTAAATRVETDLNTIVSAATSHDASTAEQAAGALVSDVSA